MTESSDKKNPAGKGALKTLNGNQWKSMFEAAGFDVTCQIAGLGRIPTIQAQYIVHTVLAMAN